MRILAHVHGYPPVHNAGAEWMLHSILRFMAERGHECKVYSVKNRKAEEFQGVQIAGNISTNRLAFLYRHADVVITHLDRTPSAMQLAHFHRRPLVHLVHNDQQLGFNKVDRKHCDLAVMNSVWLRDAVQWPDETMVVRPPVDYRQFPIFDPPGDRVTLINLNEAKGAHVFWWLANAMPSTKFLGVRGAYGLQIVPKEIPPNVEVIDNTPDVIADVYARTRVLLVPSSYESWGRVAIEAAACGIPVIAHPTPGLRESLGSAGIFVDRDNQADWGGELMRLTIPNNYRIMREKVRSRAIQLDPTKELKALEKRLLDLGGSTIAGMSARPCPICKADHATCGGPSEVRPMLTVKRQKQKGKQKLRRYLVGKSIRRLTDFTAREMGVQDQCLDPVEPTTAPEVHDDETPPVDTDAKNKARRTRQRSRTVQAPR